jgi:hypothetical protein
MKDLERWGNVKDAIKEKQKPELNDIDVDTLALWKVRHCGISQVVMLNSQFKRSPSVVPNFLCADNQRGVDMVLPMLYRSRC